MNGARMLGWALAMSLVGCATPSSAPDSLRRLEPAQLAQLSATRPAAPLSLADIVQRSQAGVAPAALVDEIRRTSTHHGLSPAEAEQLRQQGVAPSVVDELIAAQSRWAQDEATAAKVREQTARAAAEDRARAEQARRRKAYGPVYRPYYDPFWPYGYARPFGWGVGIGSYQRW